MKCVDICLPAPKTAYDAYQQRMNWMQAELIGQSIFSKTIEISDPETVLICDSCGGFAFRKEPEFIDYCYECGVVEGLTHEETI